MKTYTYALLAAAAVTGMALGQTAYTTPVGYYSFAGKAGGNLFVPGVVNASAFTGKLTAASATTLTLAANSVTAAAFNEGAVYATHYVEITSGPNAGTVLDIASNTTSVITLADDISALNLTGTESVTIRPHVTLKSALAGAEASLNAFTDSATFYAVDGTSATYIYGADSGTGWSSDFSTADGNLRPIAPGTGVVLGLLGDASLTLSGEVKATPTVAFLGAGVVNIVGQVNPLVGTSSSLNTVGFADLAAFSDSITVYQQGGALTSSKTYYPIGGGVVSEDFSTPTTDVLPVTTGAVVIPAASSAVRLAPGFTVAP